MKKFIAVLFVLTAMHVHSQELYVFSEPASNMPAHSVSAKLTGLFVPNENTYDRLAQRHKPELMFGFSKKLMVHLSATFANMHTKDFRFESYGLYAKYRFLSSDDIHKHFRMAVFADVSKTNAPFHYDEISLMGDKSGVEAGIIATQLWNKFALSGTVSHTQVLDKSRKNDVIYVPSRQYRSVNFSLSGGFLLLPKDYTNYDQLNLNVYTEFIGQRTLDDGRYFVDLAPALQFIFKSNTKLNIGRRMQLTSDMQRMTKNSWLISLERTFLNALRKKKMIGR